MKTSTPLPKEWRKGQRLRAWELYKQGWPPRTIAQSLGVTEEAISQWITRGQAHGPETLRHQPPPGAPPKRTREQRAARPGLLAQGAEAFGFCGHVWTAARVTVVITRECGVRGSSDPWRASPFGHHAQPTEAGRARQPT
jgi:transposase